MKGVSCEVWFSALIVCVTCVGHCADMPSSVLCTCLKIACGASVLIWSLILIPDLGGLRLSLKEHLQLHGGVSLTYAKKPTNPFC